MIHFHNRCVILIGPPCAGKTTWSQGGSTLAPIAPVRVSTDGFIEQAAVVMGQTYTEAFAEQDMNVLLERLYTQFLSGIRQHRDLIVDRTNLTIASRRRFLELLPNFYERIAVVFCPKFTTLRERLFERNSLGEKIIQPQAITKMIERYEPPSFDEFDRIVAIP